MDPLTPANLYYGRRTTSLIYEFVEDNEMDDPTFVDESNISFIKCFPQGSLSQHSHQPPHQDAHFGMNFHTIPCIPIDSASLLDDSIPLISQGK